MAEAAAIVRREQGDALSTILGTGDTRAALAQVERNVRDVIEVGRARGFVTHFVNENRKTGEIRETDFYGLPMWQLLGMTYGVTPLIETLEPIDGGFKAKAVAQTRDGAVVGAAFGLCQRKEPGKQYKSDHDLAAMAQSRAQRNALRSALGAALVLAGFDFPDPEGPATKAQVGLLHQLERELGWSEQDGHARAGVESYKDLTREQAAELIDAWARLRESGDGHGGSGDPGTGSLARPETPPPDDGGGAVGHKDTPPSPPAAPPTPWDRYRAALARVAETFELDEAGAEKGHVRPWVREQMAAGAMRTKTLVPRKEWLDEDLNAVAAHLEEVVEAGRQMEMGS